MDIKESFDRALDGGPEHRAIEERLVVGRRASLTRRATLGAGVLAGILAIGGVGWAVLPGATRDGSVATSRTSTSPDAEPTLPGAPLNRAMGDPLLTYELNTEYALMDGVTMQRKVDGIVPLPGVSSVAAVVNYQGGTYWAAAAVIPGQAGWANDKPAIDNRSFDQWVREQVVLRGTFMREKGFYVPGWVTLDEDGVLTAHRGATLIEQSSPARLDQAPAGVPSARATIDIEGATLCVVARQLPGKAPDIIYESEAEFQGCADRMPGIAYPGDGSAQK